MKIPHVMLNGLVQSAQVRTFPAEGDFPDDGKTRLTVKLLVSLKTDDGLATFFPPGVRYVVDTAGPGHGSCLEENDWVGEGVCGDGEPSGAPMPKVAAGDRIIVEGDLLGVSLPNGRIPRDMRLGNVTLSRHFPHHIEEQDPFAACCAGPRP